MSRITIKLSHESTAVIADTIGRWLSEQCGGLCAMGRARNGFGEDIACFAFFGTYSGNRWHCGHDNLTALSSAVDAIRDMEATR
jgi:hypothetical protein